MRCHAGYDFKVLIQEAIYSSKANNT